MYNIMCSDRRQMCFLIHDLSCTSQVLNHSAIKTHNRNHQGHYSDTEFRLPNLDFLTNPKVCVYIYIKLNINIYI